MYFFDRIGCNASPIAVSLADEGPGSLLKWFRSPLASNINALSIFFRDVPYLIKVSYDISITENALRQNVGAIVCCRIKALSPEVRVRRLRKGGLKFNIC